MRNINKTSEQLRWVILLLLIAVILPTVCLLWFMTQAVKNEQMAVKQKLIDVYTKRGKYFFVEVPDLYFSSKIEHFNSLTSHEPRLLFDFFAVSPDSQFDGALILDTDNKLVYPILDTFEIPTYDQLTEPFQIELAGNLEKAIEQYKKALSIRKDYAEAYGNMGSVYISKGNLPEAERYLKKAIEVKFNYPVAHYSLGAVYYNLGKTEEAMKELEISIEQLPQYYPALNLLGEIYLRQGNNTKAAELFRKSLRMMPDQDQIKRLLETTNR